MGTETGNSLDFAERCCDELLRCGREAEVILMDDLPLERFLDECETVLFICSTTGEGEEPLCMRKFSKFLLRADLPSDLLSFMRFAVFGLGDSSYEKFNFVSKRLWRRMQQLGATPLIPFRGEGDEQHPSGGLEVGWKIWWAEIRSALELNENAVKVVAPRHILSTEKTLPNTTIAMNTFPSKLVLNERITPVSHFQDTRLLKIQIELPANHVFTPGDVLALLPENDSAIIDDLIELMNWDSSQVLYGISSTAMTPWSFENIEWPLTLRDFLFKYVDVCGIPSRNCCARLVPFVDVNVTSYSHMHLEKLQELSKDEQEYLDYIWRPKRTMIELLRDFSPSLKVPIEGLLHVFKPLRRRQFSIASSPFFDGSSWNVELCVALIEHILPGGRGRRPGVFSKWISNLSENALTAQILPGSWNMNVLQSVETVFLFATGTGIAPIRHLIQWIRRQNLDKKLVLFFGCRSLNADFYFHDEWSSLDVQVFAAGSRDSTGSKTYIDSIIRNEKQFLQSLDTNSVACFVAGHTRLNKLVSQALAEIWSPYVVGNLKKANRFQTETWS